MGSPGVPPGAPAGGTRPDWGAVVAAARAWHASTSGLARPDFLGRHDDPWVAADREAWGGARPRVADELRDVVEPLFAVPAPAGRAQLVHGDLTGNVLLAPGSSPAVIDVSPYWRPSSYAEGTVVADALCWHGATARLLDELGIGVEAVARGLLFRALTSTRIRRAGSAALADEARRYRSAATALGL